MASKKMNPATRAAGQARKRHRLAAFDGFEIARSTPKIHRDSVALLDARNDNDLVRGLP
jgi:hypothetical protein